LAWKLLLFFQLSCPNGVYTGEIVKIVRSLLVVALFACTGSLALADGVDPLVGIKHGAGSTPITITNPNPSITGTLVQDPGNGSVCSIAGDTCLQEVFQNQLGTTLTSLNIFITTPATNLTFSCNPAETDIFTHCSVSQVAGGFNFFFSGGSVESAQFKCVGDGDWDDFLIPWLGCPNILTDKDDWKWVGGEFAVDIEGTLTNGVPDAPKGTSITTQAITTPEPGSAAMLLFGMLAFGALKIARRAV